MPLTDLVRHLNARNAAGEGFHMPAPFVATASGDVQLHFAGLCVESLFLPVMAIIFLAEIVAGRKWRDLKVVGVVAVLAIANIGFHVAVLSGSDPSAFARAAIAGFVLLILIVGGLTFFPALALGPVVEHLAITAGPTF